MNNLSEVRGKGVRRALVFDEQHAAGALAAMAAREAGYDVVSVAATNAAIRKLRADRYDLVFINLRYATGNFYRRVLRIVRRSRGAEMVVCCVPCLDSEACKLKRRGVVTLRKPFGSAALQRALGTMQ